MLLLAEDLLLLLLDDESGTTAVDTASLDLVLAGAVIVELVQLGRVQLPSAAAPLGEGALLVRDGCPTGDSVLDQGLTRVREHPGQASAALPLVAQQVRSQLLDRLVARGILRLEQGHGLDVSPSRSWPAVEVDHEAGLRKRLRDVLVAGRAPLPREVALIALLWAVDALATVLPHAEAEEAELARLRAQALTEGNVAGAAVRRAVTVVTRAVVTSTPSPVVIPAAS